MLVSAVPLSSRIKMRGVLTIHVREVATGRVLRTIVKKNTITFDAGNVMRSLIAQRVSDPAPAELQMGSMRFGTSSTTPTRYDTNLLAEVPAVRKELTDVKKVSGITGEISFQATILSTEGNGSTFCEAALFTRGTFWSDSVGGTLQMFSRQIHSSIAKTAAISLDYNWTIQFTTA
jgi:hypothetical protein